MSFYIKLCAIVLFCSFYFDADGTEIHRPNGSSWVVSSDELREIPLVIGEDLPDGCDIGDAITVFCGMDKCVFPEEEFQPTKMRLFLNIQDDKYVHFRNIMHFWEKIWASSEYYELERMHNTSSLFRNGKIYFIFQSIEKFLLNTSLSDFYITLLEQKSPEWAEEYKKNTANEKIEPVLAGHIGGFFIRESVGEVDLEQIIKDKFIRIKDGYKMKRRTEFSQIPVAFIDKSAESKIYNLTYGDIFKLIGL